MPLRPALPASLCALALALAFAAAAEAAPPTQDGGGAAAPGSGESTVASAEPAPVAAESDLRGRRARAVLKRGAVVEGVLPGGVAWEKRADGGSGFEPARAEDPAAGLRFFFVMGMDGEIFLSRSEVKEVVDLGTLSDAVAEEMKVRILEERRAALDQRRRDLEAREAQLQRELDRLLGPPAEAPGVGVRPAPTAPVAPGAEPAPEPEPEAGPEPTPPAAATAAPGTVVTPAAAAAPAAAGAPADKESTEQRRRRGDALLERFPPPAWSEERFDVIDTRTRLAKIPADAEEAAFVAGFDAWKEALERREESEAAKKGSPAPGAGGN